MKQKFFDRPVVVYDEDGTCYPDVVEVFIGNNDGESYIADSDDEILFFNEMSTGMIENVMALLES